MVLALVVFGPRRLPQIGRQIGKLMYEFRKASNDFKYQMEEELRNAEEADRKKKEEARLSTLALAAPAVATETPNAATGFTADSPYPGEEQYLAAVESETQPEEAYPGIQPPSTGEQVPAARPASQVAQSEAPAAEENISEVGPGFGPDINPEKSTGALALEVCSSINSPVSIPSSSASEDDSTTVSTTEQAAQHG
jgi:sec-independent protein translocase protein TatB